MGHLAALPTGISAPQAPSFGVLSRDDVLAELRRENAQLREDNQCLHIEASELDRVAKYYKEQHRRATARLKEMKEQVAALKSKILELQHRLFGRKSEQKKKSQKGAAKIIGPQRKRGQQQGAAGHGRTVRKTLPVVALEVLPAAEQIFCEHCKKPWQPLGEPEMCEQIDWQVRLVRIRTERPKFRRPEGCRCADGKPDIVCAPPPSTLIPKGILTISFIVQVLLLKFQDGMPAHRILRMLANEGIPLSAGTLCGVMQKIAPLFLPLYEAIRDCSRQQDLALMDETRWHVFEPCEKKTTNRWWLWVVVTKMTRLYILSPSRSSAVPKEYFGYDEQTQSHRWHNQLMADRYCGYSFLQSLLDLAYCWAHVRRDFLEARSDEKDREWADQWVTRIGEIYHLHKERLVHGRVIEPERELPAPFVQLDAARMQTVAYQKADKKLRKVVEKMAATGEEQLAAKNLRRRRRKILQSLQAHWHGLTLMVDHPQIPMDNNGAERAVRPAAIARKNFYGSGARWSGELMVMLMSLLQTLMLHKLDPRKYLSAYLQACADNGSQAPTHIAPWLPWNFSASANPSHAAPSFSQEQPCAQIHQPSQVQSQGPAP